jgi:hypothetical protein
MFAKLTLEETRSVCKEKIEALEYWLRRLIDAKLSAKYGPAYFEAIATSGLPVFGQAVRKHAALRMAQEPSRYARKVDTLLLEEEIKVICKEYVEFKDAFAKVFDNANEARSFLNKVREARNPLYHANPITLRQAEQAYCYSNDILDSLKHYYTTTGMTNLYDAPLIIKMEDSFGNVRHRQAGTESQDFNHGFAEDAASLLRVGDVLKVTVEIDPAYDPSTYSVSWSYMPGFDGVKQGASVEVKFTDSLVSASFVLMCSITSNKAWHRKGDKDDFMLLAYRVLPT